jgi:hypothetical protein
MNLAEDANRPLRWAVYWLLLITLAATISGRIASLSNREGTTPFLSANDRSRWSMIRALGDHGTYAIDDVIFNRETGKRTQGWHTIDLVRHRGSDGREHYYSSKPVLMPTLMAGVYWVVKQATGASLAEHPFYVGRIVLWLCNVPPLLLMGWLLARLIDRYGRGDWSRLFAMTAFAWGTLLTPFLVTLNNHLHAAVCVTVTVYCLLRLWNDGDARARHYMLAGLFAALTFANELPALAFLAGTALVLLLLNWRKTLLYFAPPALLVLVAMTALNYVAHGSLKPPYAHRHDGAVVVDVPMAGTEIGPGPATALTAVLNKQLKQPLSDAAVLSPRLQVNAETDVTDRYTLWDEPTQQRFAVRMLRDSGEVEVRQWDNWYEYEGTYWTADNKRGLDRGEPSKLVYAFHCLVGHHGLFSLTPLWLIAFGGLVQASRDRDSPLRLLAVGTLLISLACLGFYLFLRPLEDRNYGGVCNGLRWMMWCIPLYLLGMLPALARLGNYRAGRAFAYACLAISTFSAAYTPMNPWSQPWIFDYWEYLQWIAY